jgi:Mechanosensitive ion channel
VVFVFVKHPFDVGDRVTIYGNTGALLHGDDYFVKEISLLYTEFKKMEGHVVQAPNSYLNTLFILNQRRSGGLAEAVPIVLKFGTTLEQIDTMRQRLLEFVRCEKREYQPNILTELRAVTENFSITLNVVFFYKSNWQNEGLRLQRRNKFISMVMISLQEIGIEGPRMNLQGAHVDFPLHVFHHGAPPSYSTATADGRSHDTPQEQERSTLPENPDGTRPHHSILRRGIATAAARARGESPRPDRHVDFSLGMSRVSSDDVMGDVYWDRGPSRVDDIVRMANRESEERERCIQEEESRTPSRVGSISVSSVSGPRVRGGLDDGRLSDDSQRPDQRSSYSPSLSRSHVLSRLGSHRERGEQDHLMEQGRYELRDLGPGPAPSPSSVPSHNVSPPIDVIHHEYPEY